MYNTISFAVAAQSRNLAEAERSPVGSVASPSSISGLFCINHCIFFLSVILINHTPESSPSTPIFYS